MEWRHTKSSKRRWQQLCYVGTVLEMFEMLHSHHMLVLSISNPTSMFQFNCIFWLVFTLYILYTHHHLWVYFCFHVTVVLTCFVCVSTDCYNVMTTTYICSNFTLVHWRLWCIMINTTEKLNHASIHVAYTGCVFCYKNIIVV